MTGAVLVTGALGHVGSTTVRELVADGTKVVATDVLTDANRKVVGKLPKRASTYWADLTDADAVERMVADIEPSAIVHLAAVIPPSCYCNPTLARKVNVEGTAALIAAAQRLSSRPRFVQASSVAVYGPRNPYLTSDLLGPETPFSPIDTYGQHKVEAESLVRSFALDWVILRLGAVLDTNLFALTTDADALLMEWALPADGRINTVDVRDVATGFRAAVTADVVGEVLMIGGDESHRLLQRDVGSGLVGATGLAGAYPVGRPGDPERPDAWFVCDWMDTARAQASLEFQNHSWPDMLAQVRAKAGVWRFPLHVLAPVLVPVIRTVLHRRSPYRGRPGIFADPWGILAGALRAFTDACADVGSA